MILPEPRTLTTELVQTTREHILVDEAFEGQPIVVSFASQGAPGRAGFLPFNFYGRLNRYSAEGTPLNRVYLRDVSGGWYHRPIAGVGETVDEIAELLRGLIERVRAPRVVFMGSSMGGYAAMMYGLLLRVDEVIAFGARSLIGTRHPLMGIDRRSSLLMEALEETPPPVRHFDLKPLFEANTRTRVDYFLGTEPTCLVGRDDIPDRIEAMNVDALHAARLAGLPGFHLHAYAGCGHDVARHLIHKGIFDRHIPRLIRGEMGPPPADPVGNLVQFSWYNGGPVAMGWVHDQANPERHLPVEIRVDGQPAGRGKAELFRKHVLDRGHGDGRAGFIVPLPAELADGQRHVLTLHLPEDGGQQVGRALSDVVVVPVEEA